MLIVVVVPLTVKSPPTVTSLVKDPVVAETGFVPAPKPVVIAPSTYVLLAASEPETGAPTFFNRFESISMWSPILISPADDFSSPVNWIPLADSNCNVPVPDVATFNAWSTSVDIEIVPESSSITFLPLTYNDPGPT